MTTKSHQYDLGQALWNSYVLGECLREAGDDVLEGLKAAQYILSTQSVPNDFALSLSMPVTHPYFSCTDSPIEWTRDNYPRNRSNQFLDKLDIVEAANDPVKRKELRDKLSEEDNAKLDACISCLTAGGTVYHPNEGPSAGIDILRRVLYVPPPEPKPDPVVEKLDQLTELVRSLHSQPSTQTDILQGGKADNRPDSDFDPKELARGILVEIEHTNNFAVAKEIARDHLSEDKEYYKKLAEVGLSVDAEGHHHRGKGNDSKSRGKSESKKGAASTTGSQARKKAKKEEAARSVEESADDDTEQTQP